MNGAAANPACACGCGWEVALPWNKFIVGHHNAPEWTDAQRAEIQQMISQGVSTYKIGRLVGRTPAAVLNWRWEGLPKPKRPAERILRWDDLRLIAAQRKELRDLRLAKRTMAEVLKLAKEMNRERGKRQMRAM